MRLIDKMNTNDFPVLVNLFLVNMGQANSGRANMEKKGTMNAWLPPERGYSLISPRRMCAA